MITGALGGLGWDLTERLARAGAHVTMAVRRPDRARQRARDAGLSVTVRELDLASLASVRHFADDIAPLDVLINNAGVMGLPRGRTEDGFETQMGVNHLGHFALTNLLLPRISDRIVLVGSRAHQSGRVDPRDLHHEHRRYTRFGAYAGSKLANLLHLLELDRRLRAAGSPLRAVAAHPGYTSTGIVQHSGVAAFDRLAAVGNRYVGMTPAEGAASLLLAATTDVGSNTYLGPVGVAGLRGRPGPAVRSRRAWDRALAGALWQASEQATGTTWPDA